MLFSCRYHRSSRRAISSILVGSIASLLVASCPFSFGADLVVSDGAPHPQIGMTSSPATGTVVVGVLPPTPMDLGLAYVFRNVDSTTGIANESATLIVSDLPPIGPVMPSFGANLSISGSSVLVGAARYGSMPNNEGAAFVYRNLDTATGIVIQDVKLVASDAQGDSQFGGAVSLSGTMGLVGASEMNRLGAAYLFKNLDTATGTIVQDAKLTASDGLVNESSFGRAVALSGSLALVGDPRIGNGSGAVYVFRNLESATGTITENARLVASDSGSNPRIGSSLSVSGTIGLAGAENRGAAYVFRNLDTVSGTVTESAKLVASDDPSMSFTTGPVSVSGTDGLVGVLGQSAVYLYRNLDTAGGTVTENVKLTASDDGPSNRFGTSVSIEGDQFVIGAMRNIANSNSSGKTYVGSVSSVTTLDAGNTSRSIDGLNFESQGDWIIGQTSSSNKVTLNAGSIATVTAAGKAVYIGQTPGSNNNTLVVAGDLRATQINIGAAGSVGNTLQIGDGGTSGRLLSPNTVIVNNGNLVFNRSDTLEQLIHLGTGGISGTGSVTQAGTGTAVLMVQNTYTGATHVDRGTLRVAGFGSIANTSEIVVASGATFDVAGVSGGASFDGSRFRIADGQTLRGDGTVLGAVNVNAGGTLSAGTGIGTLTTNSIALTSASSVFKLDIDLGVDPKADLLNVLGELSLSDSTLDLSIVNIESLSTPRTFLFAANDVNDLVSGVFGTITGAPAGFTATVLYNYSGTDDLGRVGDGNDLAIRLTAIPEPGTALSGAALVLVGLASRRRVRRSTASDGLIPA